MSVVSLWRAAILYTKVFSTGSHSHTAPLKKSGPNQSAEKCCIITTLDQTDFFIFVLLISCENALAFQPVPEGGSSRQDIGLFVQSRLLYS